LNFEWFIVRRMLSAKGNKDSISAPIIKIAIAAVAIGMVIMLVAVSTGVGLQKKIREKVAAFNGHIQISNFDNNNSKVSVNPISIHQDFYPEGFSNIPEINHIQAVATKAAIIRTETTFEGIVVKGVGKDYRWDYLKEYLVDGNIPDYSDSLNEQVLVSKYLADRLQLKTGSRFNTYFLKEDASQTPNLRVFEVSGIFDSGFQEFDQTYLIADIRHIQRINKWNPDQVGTFEIFINDISKIKEIGDRVYAQTPSNLDAQTIADAYYSIFEWLSLFDFNIALILGIMILVAGINMITALLVLILERTSMIGLLKSLGSTDQSIRKIFLINAGYLITVGLFFGDLIGFLLILSQKYFGLIKLNPENYYVSEAPVYLSLTHFLLLNLGTMLLCLLMLVIPSYIITKIQPSRVLRFQ
jgi:lipoprotein-releasing system permease protein